MVHHAPTHRRKHLTTVTLYHQTRDPRQLYHLIPHVNATAFIFDKIQPLVRPWAPVVICGRAWASVGAHGHPSPPVGVPGRQLASVGVHGRTRKRACGRLWASVGADGHPCASVSVRERPWASIYAYELPRAYMDIRVGVRRRARGRPWACP